MRRSVNRPEYPSVLKCLTDTRRAAGLTQIELAARMKRTQAWLSSVERGYRRMDLLQAHDFCSGCGVTMEQFGAMLDASIKVWRAKPKTVRSTKPRKRASKKT
jgi:transcriptional regulator with XRE-family HTH domain